MDWSNPNKDLAQHTEGNCFVYVQGNEADIEKYYEIVGLSKDDKFILYPEREMTYVDTVCYRQYVKSVITENPFIISSYDKDKVWVLKKGKWCNPDQQTYGASVNMIAGSILNNYSTIPMNVNGGIKAINKYKEKVRTNSFGRRY